MEFTKEYISTLIDKYGNTLLRLAYTYLKNKADAEDILQDVFLKLIDKKPIFSDENHEKAWLIRVTINLCKNKINLFWNKNKCPVDEIGEVYTYDNYNVNSSVLNAVCSLKEKYQVVVYMYYYEGYSTEDIARYIEKTGAYVRSLLHRARTKLKNILKEDYDFE